MLSPLNLSLVSGPLPRLPLGCIHPFLHPEHWPSPWVDRVGATLLSGKRLLTGYNFRGCSHFFMFRPQRLLATLIVPTLSLFKGSSCSLYFRAHHRLLPARCSGYAIRPNWVIDGTRTSTSQVQRHYRLLPTRLRYMTKLDSIPQWNRVHKVNW